MQNKRKSMFVYIDTEAGLVMSDLTLHPGETAVI